MMARRRVTSVAMPEAAFSTAGLGVLVPEQGRAFLHPGGFDLRTSRAQRRGSHQLVVLMTRVFLARETPEDH